MTSYPAPGALLQPTFSAAEPRRLFTGGHADTMKFGYDISNDGGRMLVLENTSILQPTRTVSVVTNVLEALRRRAPATQR